jgi:hypothetical protein
MRKRCPHGNLDIRQLETRVMWSDESSFTLFPTPGRVFVWRTLEETYNPECLVPIVKHWGVLCWFGQQYLGTVLCWSLITLHGRITARGYMDTSHDPDIICEPWCRVLRLQCPIHTAGTVHLWFEGHEGELQHLPCPAQSLDFKNLKMFFKKNGIQFRYGLFKTWTSPFQERLRMYWRQKVVQHHIN